MGSHATKFRNKGKTFRYDTLESNTAQMTYVDVKGTADERKIDFNVSTCIQIQRTP
jgi:hypothetical protein